MWSRSSASVTYPETLPPRTTGVAQRTIPRKAPCPLDSPCQHKQTLRFEGAFPPFPGRQAVRADHGSRDVGACDFGNVDFAGLEGREFGEIGFGPHEGLPGSATCFTPW